MRIIEVSEGKKNFEVVAGLEWHPLVESGSARTKELLDHADQLDEAGQKSDLKVLRGKESVQVGLARSSDGAKPGQISLAALITDTLIAAGQGPNALVAIQLPDDLSKYLYISIRDEIILTDGDVVNSRDQIRSTLSEDFSFGGWNTVVCPGEWGIPDSLEQDFNFYVNANALAKSKPWALKPLKLSLRKFLVPALLVSFSLGGALYGLKYWKDLKEKKITEAFQKQMALDQAVLSQKPVPVQIVKPWPLMPTPASFVDACQSSLKTVGLNAGHWQLKKISCVGGTLFVEWTKASESAWISHIIAQRPNVIVSADGMSAGVVTSATAKTSELVESLIPQTAARLRLYDLANRYRSVVSISQVAAPVQAVLPGQSPGAAPPPPPWNELAFTFTTDIPAEQVVSFLSSPGLRLKQMDFVLKAGSFQYTFLGVQYVQP